MSVPNGYPRNQSTNYGALDPAVSVVSNGYEEFFGGAVTCPSCQGAGRVPRERENELVALIPFSDNRLKPRRTLLYVCLAVGLCVGLGGLLLYFLFPRSVVMSTQVKTIHPTSIYVNETQGLVLMSVLCQYNISNMNFYPISVDKLEVTALFDQKVVGVADNTTELKVKMKTTQTHYVQLNITFNGDEGYIAYYCSDSPGFGHTLLMPFMATASSTWWGRAEETSLTTYTHVRCSKSPDDNALVFDPSSGARSRRRR